MKKILLFIVVPSFLLACNNGSNGDLEKEKELLKKELELAKKELELEKKQKQIESNQENSKILTQQTEEKNETPYSTPEEVLNAIFQAAKTQDFSELANLCDPQEKGDIESLCACRLSENYSSSYAKRQNCSSMTKKTFTMLFKDGKNPRVVESDAIYATVGYDVGNVSPEMQLVKRGERWYIFVLSSNSENY